MASKSTKKIIKMAEVVKHNKSNDLWVVIENKVYNLTQYRQKHPGGEEPLMNVAGKDGTKEFEGVGHSRKARDLMAEFYIGDLDETDRKK